MGSSKNALGELGVKYYDELSFLFLLVLCTRLST